jgi:two-component system, NtrC family, response regulator HydG
MSTKKILVVDDDEGIRKTLFLLLGKKYRVYPVGDAREALAMWRSSRADLVIADFRLPEVDGLELIKKLRAAGFKGEAVLVTGHPDLVAPADLWKYSIGCFFVKPFDLDDIMASVDRLLQPRKSQELAA